MTPEKQPPPATGFEVRSSCPILRMLDEAEGRAFYVDYLGFDVDWECRFNPDAPVFMQVRLGEACIHLDGHASEDSPKSQVNIPVWGLENYCESLIAMGAVYPKPCIEDVRYVGRPTDMNVEDPFGNLLIFCSQTTEP